MTKPGRNDPCPCGSGRKYKKCCLAVEHTPPGREDGERKKAVDHLLQFCKRHYREELDAARLFFWGDHDPLGSLSHEALDAADINFWEWVIYDWKPVPENGKSLIDLYREKKWMLSQDEVAMLQKMREAPLSLFEVQDIFPDRGLILKDILLEGEHDVREKMATRGLRRWDILACRLLQTDGNWILSGSGYSFPIEEKDGFSARSKTLSKNINRRFSKPRSANS